MMCDVCGASMTGVHARVSSAEMISITNAGYVPPRLPEDWNQRTAETGISKADVWRTLVNHVIGERGEWGLCSRCDDSVEHFRDSAGTAGGATTEKNFEGLGKKIAAKKTAAGVKKKWAEESYEAERENLVEHMAQALIEMQEADERKEEQRKASRGSVAARQQKGENLFLLGFLAGLAVLFGPPVYMLVAGGPWWGWLLALAPLLAFTARWIYNTRNTEFDW